MEYLREDIGTKKTFSFGHCPNHLNPPIDADNEGCNDNYDDNYDKND